MTATSLKAASAALLALGLGAVSAQASPDKVNGVWMRDDGNARVRIAPCGSDLCATNLWIKDTSQGEEVGDRLVMTLKPEGDKLTGTAFDPKRDRKMSMTITISDNSLDTRGCILANMVCRTVGWTRSKSE